MKYVMVVERHGRLCWLWEVRSDESEIGTSVTGQSFTERRARKAAVRYINRAEEIRKSRKVWEYTP